MYPQLCTVQRLMYIYHVFFQRLADINPSVSLIRKVALGIQVIDELNCQSER